MQDSKELVSVVIITQNQKDALYNTLCSILRQSYDRVEIIVVDNASTDGSAEYIQEKFADVANIFYLISDTIENQSNLINAGIDNSMGQYIAFAESGTIWHEDKLSRQIKELQKNEDYGCAYCTALFQENGCQFCTPLKEWPLYKKQGRILPDLLMDDFINLNSVCVKRIVIETVGGLDGELSELAAYEFLLRVAECYGISFVEEIEIEANARRRDLAGYIATQLYILVKFANRLSEFGLKAEKFRSVINKVEQYQQEKVFEIYKEFLVEDYVEFLNETIAGQEKCNSIYNFKKCTGCGVCAAKCPVGAIAMQYSREGFLRPVVDEGKCVHCNICLEYCPNMNIDVDGTPIPDSCYAVQADNEVRKDTSSGGVFPELANYVLQKGGYVAGAVFAEDFSVKHVVSNQRQVVEKMRQSKYVASDISNLYSQIRELLEQERMVLFTGCACQVVALRRYLGKMYNTLYTVDVICHGAPSPGVWKSYVQNLENKFGKIKEISFRKKEKLGWNPGIYVLSENGEEYIDRFEDAYICSFLNNWILQESCYECNFKGRKYSDFSLGDFWGINNVIEGMEDGNGTSVVTLNTKHGLDLWNEIREGFIREKRASTAIAALYNPCILKSVPKNKMRALLFLQLQEYDLQESLNRIWKELHYDIGMVFYWGSNYGNAMTNYALYCVIGKKYKVLAIDNLEMRPEGRFQEFAKRHMSCSSDYFPMMDKKRVQNSCDIFIVGSDQAWNVEYEKQFGYGKYFQMDFVADEKRKVSYATSFGQWGCEPVDDISKKLYQRFDAISVREKTGVDICQSRYGVNSKEVLDPVFLLKRRDYEKLTREVKPERESYMLVYLLNPTEEKRMACKRIQKMLGNLKMIQITEEHLSVRERNRHILEFENVRMNLEVEQWVSYFQNSSFVVTDSFHGTCFALIFHKEFFAFVNRQSDRFELFKQFLELEHRIIEHGKHVPYELIGKQIDYDMVDEMLEKRIKDSYEWLEEAIGRV